MGMFTDIKKLLHPYYIFNFLLSASFLLCKGIPPLCDVVFDEYCEVDEQQMEILFLLLMVLFMIRARKTGSGTIVSYFANSFTICKVANTFLWFFVFKPYGLAFLLLFLLLAMLIPQPLDVKQFTDIKEFMEETSKESCTWLIEFYAALNPSCVNFASILPELSPVYSQGNLKFGKVDLRICPQLRYYIMFKYHISDLTFSTQLPMYFFFRNGLAGLYRPVIDSKGNMKIMVDLNNLHSECKNQLKNKKLRVDLKKVCINGIDLLTLDQVNQLQQIPTVSLRKLI